MRTVKNTLSILTAIAVIDTAGILLRINHLDTYFILFGFRFQLSFVVPIFFVLKKENLSRIKSALTSPGYKKKLQPLIWVFVPFIIVCTVLYFTKIIEIGDPEYFYEFGLSSIFDLPVYLVWNFPQLLLLVLYIVIIQADIKESIPLTSLIIIMLFAYQFIPFGKEHFYYPGIIALIITAVSAAFLLRYFSNVYWICITIFMIFWLNFLAFGLDSQMMIHILFAARYSEWAGFFEVKKTYGQYILPLQLIITFIFIYINIHPRGNKIKKKI